MVVIKLIVNYVLKSGGSKEKEVSEEVRVLVEE